MLQGTLRNLLAGKTVFEFIQSPGRRRSYSNAAKVCKTNELLPPEEVFRKVGGEGEISVPNGQSHNIMIYKELVASKKDINLDLTDAHSYFIIVPQSPEEVLLYENTYALGT